MSNLNQPSEWYLDQFSRDDDWKHGVDTQMVTQVEGLISTEAIDAIAEELRQKGCPADRGKLGNLLRHWVMIQLLEEGFTGHNEQRKRTRAAAKSLAKTMAKLAEQLDAPMAEVSHNASRYVQHQYRISYTKHLFYTLRRCLGELTPAVQALSEEKFQRGHPQKAFVKLSVEYLLEVFEFVTGKRAGRTYDPIEGREVSAFSQFVASAFSALKGDEAPTTDSAVRTVLAERRKREEASPEHMRPFDDV